MQDIERLDFSKPPPGYMGPDENTMRCCWHMSAPADDYFSACQDTPQEALVHAWAHYQERHDPPRFLVSDDGEGHAAWLLPDGLTTNDVEYNPGYATEAEARAAAWAHYKARLTLAERVESLLLAPGVAAEVVAESWPCCLTWSNEQAAAVERWLVDSTAEMPEVFCG